MSDNQNHKIPSYDTLYHLYIKKDYTRALIAKNYKVSKSTVNRWLNTYGIKKTKRSFMDRLFDWLFG